MAVTKNRILIKLSVLFSWAICCLVNAAILSEDRADVLYHSYQGGGMSIDGPAVMLRKKASDNFAITGFYYVDTISSASIDVLSNASEYAEDRNEAHLGFEYLHNKTTLAMNFAQSEESDYLAKTVSLNLAHDAFGDLTTVSMGLSFGDDEVRRNGDDEFLEEAKHYKFKAGVSQILTRNLTASINVEAIADQGFLNNPYRTVRYRDSKAASGYSYQAELYPNTRNSFSTRFTTSYYLPYRAALFAHYRYFKDSWEIEAEDVEFEYRHPFGEHLLFDISVRYYRQNQAAFYQDLFEYKDAQNYRARDKELSDFNDLTVGVGLTYTLPEKYSINNWQSEVAIQWDHIMFDYNNFHNVLPSASSEDVIVGQEPLYSFSANVLRVFASVYY